MDQNNFNGVQNDQAREPLPNFEQQPVYQQPVYQQPVYQQPMYQQPAYQQPMKDAADQQIEAAAGSAFGKSLAATIMAWFPITSIIAIILGAIGLKGAKSNNEYASRLGKSAGGKNNAAKILGIVGLVSGIVMTIFWVAYIIGVVLLANYAAENPNEFKEIFNDIYRNY